MYVENLSGMHLHVLYRIESLVNAACATRNGDDTETSPVTTYYCILRPRYERYYILHTHSKWESEKIDVSHCHFNPKNNFCTYIWCERYVAVLTPPTNNCWALCIRAEHIYRITNGSRLPENCTRRALCCVAGRSPPHQPTEFSRFPH